MGENQGSSSDFNRKTSISDSCIRVCDEDLAKMTSSVLNQDRSLSDKQAAFEDAVVCVPGPRLVLSGFTKNKCTDDFVMFVNTGGGPLRVEESSVKFKPDSYFQGGNVLTTEENITEGGDYPSIYQSARSGNFCYQFQDLVPGDYFVDLHFVEIIYMRGPKGMRVFNVFMQEEKVLSELDIYCIAGANKPLQLVDTRVSVRENGKLEIKFEGVQGNSLVSGICIRRASKLTASDMKAEHIICNNCAAEVEVPQNKLLQLKSTAKYEKKIQELTSQCELKTKECYEAWMSLSSANEQLDKTRLELGEKLCQVHSLDRASEKKTASLTDVSSRYERDKKFWTAAVNDLEGKIKVMKKEQSQLSREAHDCANSVPELNKMVFAVQSLVAQCEDLKLKYSEEQVQRKKLFNQVQEAKGNIRVFCRCRPLSHGEVVAGYSTVVDFEAAKDGDIGVLTGNSIKKTFKFDRVYTPKDDQVDIFADASPMAVSVLDGYNVCIFAYGQTGTGKTFTMEGTEQNRGVNYRTLQELFKIAKERSDSFSYSISVSVLEVYNEQIRDLLATSPTSKKLEIRQASEGVHHVPGLVEAKVENIKEVWDVLQAGSNARAVGSNNVNEHSSRSHCMLCIMVRTKNLINGECTKSKLWLVDLAGSERLGKTDAQGERLKEAQFINKSLSALGDVISALANKSTHIPYRNSKLTQILQDSLGGDSKTLMFVQISPSENDVGETLSSLTFATRVRGIELGPVKKQIDTGEIQKLKTMLDKARQESRSKDEAVRKLEENVQNLESKTRSKDQLCRTQQDKVKDLEGQLNSNMELHNQLETQIWQYSEKMKAKEEAYVGLQEKVKELENKTREREHSGSMTLQLKVKELENKLKEEQAQHQHESSILQQKVKELENKLKEREQNSESLLLRQKVKELEDKLREREQQSESMLLLHTDDKPKFTPRDRKVRLDEEVCENDPPILRSSNSISRPNNQESLLLRGTSSLREIRRKRDSRSGEGENVYGIPSNLLEKKIIQTDPKKAKHVPVELERGRHLDPSKALSRFTKTTKPVVASHRLSSHSRITRDQVVGAKDKDRTRVWSR